MTRLLKVWRILFGLLLWLFVATSYAQALEEEPFFDLFSGTLHHTADGLILRRCATGADEYRLFAASKGQTVLDKLSRTRAQHPASTPVSVGLLASYRAGKGGRHELLVNSTVEDPVVGSSCHLLDMLEELEQGNPKALEQWQHIQQEVERVKHIP